MKIRANAKINLALDITGRRADGYHLVRMVMQTLELHDSLEIESVGAGEQKIILHTDSSLIEDNEDNLAWKAAKLLIDEFEIKDSTTIKIKKRIPVAAGLAGGSSDAAAVLKAMNELYGLGLTDEELKKRGLKLGADVPYCISGGTMLSEGIGEILSPVDGAMPESGVLLVKIQEGVSTKTVYEAFDGLKDKPHADVDAVLDGLRKKDLGLISENLANVLESVTIPMLPLVGEIKEDMLNAGAVGTLMSGSGPTVFGFFRDEQTLQKAGSYMRDRYRKAEVITSVIA